MRSESPSRTPDARQLALREAILSGPRGRSSPFPLVAADGSLRGPFGLMVRYPTWGEPLQELGAALRYESILPGRAREIVILTVAAATNSAFEAEAHTAVGLSVGLSPDEVESLLAGRFTSADPLESAVLDASVRLLGDDASPTGDLPDDQAAEVVVLVGYYRLLAQLMRRLGAEDAS